MTPVSVTGTTVGETSEEPAIPSICVVGVDDQQHSQTEIITESISTTPTEGSDHKIYINLRSFIGNHNL